MNTLALRAQGFFRRKSERGGTGAVPGRIMAPRIIFVTATVSLILFGFLMIYSASSIAALTHHDSNYDAAYYLFHQIMYAGVGLVVSLFVTLIDYRRYSLRVAGIATAIICILLVLTRTGLGHSANGASRWIGVGAYTIQPSEFAKVILVANGAKLCCARWSEGRLDDTETIRFGLLGLAIPLALILFQPDKGTCGVIIATVVFMAILAGASKRRIAIFTLIVFAAGMTYSFVSDYSRERILTMIDPWRDPMDNGYQLIQGFYAFGSGGLFGRGIGMSRQKYNYLPMSYNDLIFAVVGEELGFVGCIAMIAVFIIYLWAGLKIAENASDHLGRLIAAGSSAMVFIQLLLNLMGVLALFPLSGKPVPFVSYGGSSVMSSMLLAALTLNVSLRSTLPETAADRFRSYLHVAEDRPRTSRSHLRLLDDEDAYDEYGVSEAMPRSKRSASDRSQSQGRERFRVVEGGAQEAATSADREAEREAKPTNTALGSTRRVTSWGNAHGFERLNLNDESAADRLRRRD